MTGDPSRPDDPFDGLVLDESFVLGARKAEGSAAERTAAAARSRFAHDDLEARRQQEVAAARAATRRAARRRRSRWFVGMTTLVVAVVAGSWWLSNNAQSLFEPRDTAAAGSFGDRWHEELSLMGAARLNHGQPEAVNPWHPASFNEPP